MASSVALGGNPRLCPREHSYFLARFVLWCSEFHTLCVVGHFYGKPAAQVSNKIDLRHG